MQTQMEIQTKTNTRSCENTNMNSNESTNMNQTTLTNASSLMHPSTNSFSVRVPSPANEIFRRFEIKRLK